MNLIDTLIGLLSAGIIGFLGLWLSRKMEDIKREEEMVFLQILVPKKESKEDKETSSEQFSSGQDFKEVIGVMDHLYQSLYGIFNSRLSRHMKGQDFLSLEYAALGGEILFFMICPRRISHVVEKQITSFYPDVIIDEVEDYNIFTSDSYVSADTLLPAKDYSFSFKSYAEMKSDPLNAITNAFSKLKVDEGAAVQFLIRPAASGWQKKLQSAAVKMINPKHRNVNWYNPISWLSAFFALLTSNEVSDVIDVKSAEGTGNRVTQVQEERSKMLDEKACNPGYYCTLRVIASSETQAKAQNVLSGILSSFAQFESVREMHSSDHK